VELDSDALLVAKRGVDGVYTADPKTHSDARRYDRLTYTEALQSDIKVMDASAFVLANEQRVIMHIFDVDADGAMARICAGEDVGTIVTP
jgi:uridylate kinase